MLIGCWWVFGFEYQQGYENLNTNSLPTTILYMIFRGRSSTSFFYDLYERLMPACLFWSLYMSTAYMGLTSCSWSCLYGFTTEGGQTSNLHITHKQLLWSNKPKPNWKRTDNRTLYICDIMLYNVECIKELICFPCNQWKKKL